MPDTTRPLQVFLSYASQDKSVVQELSRRLVDEGWIDAWLDVKKLLPGQDWRTKIEEAVETSDIVIICLSNNSVTKEGYVQKELRYAREIALEKPEETIFLVPLRLDDCEVPRGLRFYQWVDYFGEKKEESYSALIESLKLRYKQKLKLEEAERARKENLERVTAERLAQEKASRERAERETAEKIARENAEKESAEKVRLEAEEQARKKAAREKAKRETYENVKPKVIKPESVEGKSVTGTSQNLPNKTEIQSQQRKSGSQVVFVLIGLVGIIIIASSILPSLRMWFSSLQTPITTATVTLSSPSGINAGGQSASMGHIAFDSNRDCFGNDNCANVYYMNADGTNLSRLTSGTQSNYNYNPAISPDGKSLVFSAKVLSNDDIFIINLVNFEISLLFKGSGLSGGTGNLSWSPDGTQIVYDSYVNNDVRNVIEVFDLGAAKTTRLTLNLQDDSDPSFSFDGRKLSFLSSNSSPTGLYVMNVDGANRTFLFGDMYCLQPEFSPTELVIALQCRKTDNSWDLFLYDAVKHKLTQLTSFPADEGSPSWSPDGKSIVFSSNMDDPDYKTCSQANFCNYEIYTIKMDGSNLTRLITNDADDNNPDWGP